MKYSTLVSVIAVVLLSGGAFDSKAQTLEEKIGQMILVGFRGTEIDDGDRIVSDIQNHNVGGVVLYDTDVQTGSETRNIESSEQIAELTSSLQNYADIPLFVAVDQEGGRVTRLDANRGFSSTVSHRRMGVEDDPNYTGDQAEVIAQTLNDSGVNINFAPVLDLYTNPGNPIIGRLNRSFSSDPETVTEHASIFIEEHRKRTIFNAVKHFPGYGSFEGSEYSGIPDMTESWEDAELKPYRMLIREGELDIVMVSNLFHRELDDEYPASLSSAVIDDLLRDELGFDGVILTESPQMEAISENYGFEEGVRQQFRTGADMLQFANNLVYNEEVVEDVISIGVEMVENGEVSEARIDASYDRIMNLKEEL